MKIVGIIQARASSSRLPNKIHLPLTREHSLLEFLIKRISKVNIDWWLATTVSFSDDFTASVGKSLGLETFRGEVENVLSRFLTIGRSVHADWIVRVTADNPFVEASRILELISSTTEMSTQPIVVTEDLVNPQFPVGYLPEIVSFEGLELVAASLSENRAYHESNVTSYLKPNYLKVFTNETLPRRPELRWTIDTNLDLNMARNILKLADCDPLELEYNQILNILDYNPWIKDINSGVMQKSKNEI